MEHFNFPRKGKDYSSQDGMMIYYGVYYWKLGWGAPWITT